MDKELNKWYENYFKKCKMPKLIIVDYPSIIKHLNEVNNENFKSKIAKLNEEFTNIIQERRLKVHITIR